MLMEAIGDSIPSTLPKRSIDSMENGGKAMLERAMQSMSMSPLGARFVQKLRPCLDVVDRLRSLGLSEEGITLPTIVVVGDQSSGKSSVLESLSGVELPKGQGIVTRVPLVLRLNGTGTGAPHGLPPKVSLSYLTKNDIAISEQDISSAITAATIEIAGSGKSIVNKPITLNVCRPGAPDLTLVDLPGITRVPVHGQPDNIFDQVKDLILEYITPKDTIILNVLNAAMDFSVCESIRLSRQVDELGKRTLAVITKVDMCPDGLLQKVTDDAVKIGLGYICVRNRTPKEASFEEAKLAETELFSLHPELRKFSQSMVGIGALANRLVQLQTKAIADVLPTVLKQIDSSLEVKQHQLQQLSASICNVTEASVAFFKVCDHLNSNIKNILLLGESYNAELTTSTGGDASSGKDRADSNYNAILDKEFRSFAEKITMEFGSKVVSYKEKQGYLDCIERQLAESLGTNLPNVVSQTIIENTIQRLLGAIANFCTSDLPSFVHDAALNVAFSVVQKHIGGFPNLRKLYISSFQQELSACKRKCYNTVVRMLEMEKAIVYTTSTDQYNTLLSRLLQAARDTYSQKAQIEGLLSSVDVSALVRSRNQPLIQAAASILAYWVILSRRLVDQISHELRFSFNEALLKVPEAVVVKVVEGSYSVEEIMVEQAEVAHERLRLYKSILMLSESKKLMSELFGDACFA